MKFTLLPALLSTSVLGLNIGRAQATAQVTFVGAAGAQFTQDFPTDGSNVKISQVDVGPPQTQVQGSCRFGSGSIPSNPGQTQPTGGQVLITFVGAANAQFQQQFPTNGVSTKINCSGMLTEELRQSGNPLSISHISSTTGGVKCTFNGIDNSVTTINGAQTVDVGPPQTQISGTCHAA
ncbi:similar to An07g00330 [Aspergillus luchuensis]|uniref:Similar to An07g00330 n=1 Tax=Aspergillus kawachii TaxID=1069201 RepID=A0A146EZG7_ASPKA|nr:similar to An07g00330 [Aspergillus luchuensis]